MYDLKGQVKYRRCGKKRRYERANLDLLIDAKTSLLEQGWKEDGF